MNYELNKYFTKLHKHIVKEQLQIETLQKQLQQYISNWGCQNQIATKPEHENIVSIKQVRNNLENKQNKAKFSHENQFAMLLGNDKDGYAGLFIKLNQQLHKWVETELELLKEINKTNKSAQNDDETQQLMQDEDLEIISNFYNRQSSRIKED
jgi:hypothetical protein